MRLIHSMLILLLSRTGALLYRNRNVLQFRAMIICAQPDSWPLFDYAGYGCYCGLGGSGTPVDNVDRCCEVHDQCYGDAMHHDDCVPIVDNPYTKVYSYRCDEANKTFTCLNDNDPCEKFICECDRNAAMCLAKADYNDGNNHLPSERCT